MIDELAIAAHRAAGCECGVSRDGAALAIPTTGRK